MIADKNKLFFGFSEKHTLIGYQLEMLENILNKSLRKPKKPKPHKKYKLYQDEQEFIDILVNKGKIPYG